MILAAGAIMAGLLALIRDPLADQLLMQNFLTQLIFVGALICISAVVYFAVLFGGGVRLSK